MQKNNPFLGAILQENPNFWEDNGYKKINPLNYHYYGCNRAKLNKYPVYRKRLFICHNMEEDSIVEVFPCGIGVDCNEYIVAIHTWNNAGGSKFSLDVAKQVSTIDSFNTLITDYLGTELEDGTYLLKTEKMTQYVDKDVLVEEIERMIKNYSESAKEFGDEGYNDNVLMEQCKTNACKQILSFLDTLEVKEVDLEEEARKWEDKVYLECGHQDTYGTPHAPFHEIGNAFIAGAKLILKMNQKGE